tara:strand:+ start:498 stop:1250 length:753 start_codon:yes stop_codon:yes gene_type:complete
MAYKQNPARGQADSYASFIGKGLLSNKPRATKSGSGRKKEGKFITTQYTQPHQTTTQGTPGVSEQYHSQTVTQKDGGKITDHGTTVTEGADAKPQTSVKRQYQDRVSEVHRKKLDKDMSKSMGKDIYTVTKKKAVKQTTSMDGKPGSYTFEKYDRFGDVKKSKTKEVNKSNRDRLAKKAQKFTGSKRIARNTAQKDAKLINKKNTLGSTGVLGTGEQKIKEGRRTFQAAKKAYESGEGEKTYVTNKRKKR